MGGAQWNWINTHGKEEVSFKMKTVCVWLLSVALLISSSDLAGVKRNGNSKRRSRTKVSSEVRDTRRELDPLGVLKPDPKKDVSKDLAQVVEDTIVNEHLQFTNRLLDWLHKVLDAGKGIANAVCNSVHTF